MTAAWLAASLAAACGGAAEPAVEPSAASGPARSEGAGITWQVLVGVEPQTIAIADLGVSDRDAWLAAHPRLVIAAGTSARLAFPFVADPGRRDAVQLLGYFAQPLGGDEALTLTAPTAAPGRVSGLFEVYLVQDGGAGPARLAGQARLMVVFDIHTNHCTPDVSCIATRVGYRLQAPGTGPEVATGTVSDAAIAVGPVTIRLFVPDVIWAQPT